MPIEELTTNAELGYGTHLRRGDGNSPESFTLVPEMTSIGNLGEENETIDATHMTSPGARREFIYNLAEGSELDCEAHYLPTNATQQGLISDNKNRVTRNFEVELFDAAGSSEGKFLFSALVTKWEVPLTVDEIKMFNFTLKITGEITGDILT